MATKYITLLTIPVDKKEVWIGIKSLGFSSIDIGLQYHDESLKDEQIWTGGMSLIDDTEDSPCFIHKWRVTKIFALCLARCKDSLMLSPLLTSSGSAFRPYDCPINPGLLAKYVSKKEIEEIRNEVPPLDYIINVINMGKEQRLLFDEKLTREFLIKNYYINEQVNNALNTLNEYKEWRDQLAKMR